MAFWNRKKKKKLREQEQEQEILEREEAGKRLAKMREEKKARSQQKEMKEEVISKEELLKQEQVKPVSKSDQMRYVTENCQAIRDAEKQIAKIREEYESVTEYLVDIQKIDTADKDSRKKLSDCARNILRLTEERNKYKNRNLTISESVIRQFEPYEEELVDEIKKMYATESYQKAIEGDIVMLQEEKKKLRQEKKEIVEKQNALKSMARVLAVLIISLFVLFGVIYYATEIDMTFPYLGTVLLAAISATVIFVEANKNRTDMMRAERKTNKAIELMNRVKIKCVNNINVWDFAKQKFGVKNAADFEEKWNEYCKVKEYERKFRENTDQLNYYCELLLSTLKELEVQDCDIWIRQIPALNDSREMVEVRHNLNKQRQILRERIAYNEDMKKEFVRGIDAVIKAHPENRKAIMEILEQYSETA